MHWSAKQVAMATEESVNSMSTYFRGLNVVSRNQYLDKLKYVRGREYLPARIS